MGRAAGTGPVKSTFGERLVFLFLYLRGDPNQQIDRSTRNRYSLDLPLPCFPQASALWRSTTSAVISSIIGDKLCQRWRADMHNVWAASSGSQSFDLKSLVGKRSKEPNSPLVKCVNNLYCLCIVNHIPDAISCAMIKLIFLISHKTQTRWEIYQPNLDCTEWSLVHKKRPALHVQR